MQNCNNIMQEGFKPAPTPEEIRALREAAGLTQTQAASLIYSALRTWQQWERGDRAMHPAFWKLFEIRATLIIDMKKTEQ